MGDRGSARLSAAERVPAGWRARDLAPEPHGSCSWRSTGSSRTARPRSCGASSSRPATSRSPSSQGQPRRFVRPRSSTGSRTCGPAWPSSERVCDSPIRFGRSSTSVWSCPGGLVQPRFAEGISTRRSIAQRGPDASATRSVAQAETGPGSSASDRQPRARRRRRRRASSRSGSLQLRKRYDLRRAHAAVRGLGRWAASSAGSTRAVPRAEARDRDRRVRAPLHPGGVPTRPHSAERARRARMDGAPVHLDTTSCTTRRRSLRQIRQAIERLEAA